ncbi:hypothetical protein ACZ90_00385 [Streptomyces albus subsp. albus]|nr:hypothetical protein ACZ90_00385 [Streptomyces albus subsp. albus]
MAMNDEQKIKYAVKAAQQRGEVIDHGTARAIASRYNDYRTGHFVTTGYMSQGNAMWLMNALKRGVDAQTLERDRAALDALCGYLLRRQAKGETGRVDGWSGMWVPEPVLHIHVGHNLPSCLPDTPPACFSTVEHAIGHLQRELQGQQEDYWQWCESDRSDSCECHWCDVARTIEAALSAMADGDAADAIFRSCGGTVKYTVQPPLGPDVAYWATLVDADRAECEHNEDGE